MSVRSSLSIFLFAVLHLTISAAPVAPALNADEALLETFTVRPFFSPDRIQHPGVVVSRARITAIKAAIASKLEPVYSAYKKALASPSADPKYRPRGPPASGTIDCGSYDHPDNGCSDEDRDGDAAALQSLLFAINGSMVYANNAIAIMNAYARGFHKYTNSNAPLQASSFPPLSRHSPFSCRHHAPQPLASRLIPSHQRTAHSPHAAGGLVSRQVDARRGAHQAQQRGLAEQRRRGG